MKKGVIFDMDGLLIDTEQMGMDNQKVVLEQMGYIFSEKLAKDCIGRNHEGFIKAFKGHYGEDFPFEEFIVYFRAQMARTIETDGLKLKDGALDTVKKFKELGYKIAVGTSSREETAIHHLEMVGILPYLDALATGDMVKRGKPSPDIFLLAAEKLGLLPEECYVFEDSFNGVKAANAGGFYVIMVPDINQPNDDIKALTNKILTKISNFFNE